MKKINNKGFMLAEIIIVSAIIMLAIVGVYKGFSSTHEIYAIRNSYYDSNMLYSLKNFENFLIDSMVLNDIKANDSFTFQKIDKDTYKSNEYQNRSLEYFFDTYAISKLYLVKYDEINIKNFTNDTNTEVDSDIRNFVKFYIKNLPDEEQYDKYDYVLVARTGAIKTSDNKDRQVAEKYGALRIGTGNSKAPDVTPGQTPTQTPVTDPCTNNDPITISYNGDYELLHNNKIMKIKTDGTLTVKNEKNCASKKIQSMMYSGGWSGNHGYNASMHQALMPWYSEGESGKGGAGGEGCYFNNIDITKGSYQIGIGRGGIYTNDHNGNLHVPGSTGIYKSDNSKVKSCPLGSRETADPIDKNSPISTKNGNLSIDGYNLGTYAQAGSSKTKCGQNGANGNPNTANGGNGGGGGCANSQGVYQAFNGGNGGSGIMFLYYEDGFKIG